jgi:hypothetical protein
MANIEAFYFNQLPGNNLKPRGWLRQQLQIQAAGLTGHLAEFWEYVGPNSGWLGGDGEDWERGPYYADGLLPLAYLLEDEDLIAKANKWVDWTLNSQDENGFFGPRSNDDWWPRIVMLKVLIQHYGFTEDSRVISFMDKYFRYQRRVLPERPLTAWAVPRSGDNIYAILWLYGKTQAAYLLELVEILHQQSTDWTSYFSALPYQSSLKDYIPWESLQRLGPGRINDNDYQQTHTVNIAMGLKKPALYGLLSGEDIDQNAPRAGIEQLMRYHGLANGIWAGDEHLSGNNPTQGSELCSVVEYMFSLEVLAAVYGQVFFDDQLEKVAYNALPATIAPDWRSHQYDQQVNQIKCSQEPRPWYNNGEASNLFSLEPNFGCCTANMHQGWPKFVTSMWMKKGEDTLVAVVYGPNELRHEFENGERVRIVQETDYPFSGSIEFHIEAEQPLSFNLMLRIPAWAEGASVQRNGTPLAGVTADEFFTLPGSWQDGDRVTLNLPLQVRVTEWFNRSVAVERGPLLFALPIKEQWIDLPERSIDRDPQAKQAGFLDFAIRPQSPWNYALRLADGNVVVQEVKQPRIGAQPFAPQTPPVEITVEAKPLKSWQESGGNTTLLPVSPVVPHGEETTPIQLIPYGGTNLRIAQFPWFE